MTDVRAVRPEIWRVSIERALADGERFAGAWAAQRDGRLDWNVLLVAGERSRIVTTEAVGGEVDSIIELTEAANWDEREAHDLYGLRFAGHVPLRALVTHSSDPETWMTPVHGPGVHQVAVGPIHAGIIESGHFRFHAVGERVLTADTRLFYKHRGLERAAEGRTPQAALPYIHRACAACSVTNTVAYAQAVEDALGLVPDRQLSVNRTVLLELERAYNHLNDIGAICAGVGFAPGNQEFGALKDQAQEVIAAAVGHRFLFHTVAVGAGGVELDAQTTDTLRRALREVREDFAAGWRELEFTVSLQARLGGVGVLDAANATRLGAVGPAARAAGIADDVRSHSPLLAYDGFEPAMLTGPGEPGGDVRSRLRMRAAELEPCFDILDELLAAPLARGQTLPGAALPGRAAESGVADGRRFGVGRVESPRGSTACAVELAGEQVARVHLRTGAYANWPALGHAVTEAIFSDFPLINKSFELCYACVDR